MDLRAVDVWKLLGKVDVEVEGGATGLDDQALFWFQQWVAFVVGWCEGAVDC